MSHVKDLLSPYLDRRLSPAEMKKVEEHFSSCAECRTEFEELRAAVQKMKGFPQASLPSGYMARLERKMRAEDSREPFLTMPYKITAFAFSGLMIIFISKGLLEFYVVNRGRAAFRSSSLDQLASRRQILERSIIAGKAKPADLAVPESQLKGELAAGDEIRDEVAGYRAQKMKDEEKLNEEKSSFGLSAPAAAPLEDNPREFSAGRKESMNSTPQSAFAGAAVNQRQNVPVFESLQVRTKKQAPLSETESPDEGREAILFAKNYVSQPGQNSVQQKIRGRSLDKSNAGAMNLQQPAPVLKTGDAFRSDADDKLWSSKPLGERLYKVQYLRYSFEVDLEHKKIRGLDADSQQLLKN